MFKRRKKPVLDHQHRWFATGVTQIKNVQSGIETRHYTEVLYFCPDCNGNKTTQLDGVWTLRQIAGYDEFDPNNVSPPVTSDMVEQAKQDLAKWTDDVGS